MGSIINYLDTQSEIQLITDARLYDKNSRMTELFFLLKGSAELQINEVSYLMQIDDIVVVNKYEEYKLETNNQESLLFRFSISDFLLSQAFETETVSFNCNSINNSNKNFDLLRNLLIEFIDLLLFENTKTNFLKMSKIYQLLNELSSLFIEHTTLIMDSDERVRKITREIKERYYENITLSEMADLVHMDVAYFSKYFKKNTGENFKDYLSDVRIKYAVRDLVNSNKTITRIAVDNGFFSTNGFNKKFKEVYKETPSSFRIKHKLDNKSNIESVSTVRNYYENYKAGHVKNDSVQKSYLQLEYKQQKVKPIDETWCKILNVGEAEMVSNSNLKQHLFVLQENLHFTYGRIWGVFTKSNLGETLFEYEVIDEILDALLEIGLIPWISINKVVGTFKEGNYSNDSWEKLSTILSAIF